MASTDSEVRVRACGPEELAAVLDLWEEARGEAGRTDNLPSLRALVEHDPSALLVAAIDGRIRGSLIAVWDGWRGNMYRLTVHPSYRRRGIARRLVAAGERRLHSVGAQRISALVWREDQRAACVWLACGYQHEAGTGRFVKMVIP